MDVEQQSAKGIIEGDHIKLLEPIQLANGTFVDLTITVSSGDEDNATQWRGSLDNWEQGASATQTAEEMADAAPEARERQEGLLRDGIHLGGPPYPGREELHER